MAFQVAGGLQLVGNQMIKEAEQLEKEVEREVMGHSNSVVSATEGPGLCLGV